MKNSFEFKFPPKYEALSRVRAWKDEGLTIVFTNGCFDLLHPGHLKYLEDAKGLGDKLVLGLNDDASVNRLKGDPRPLNDLQFRAAMLAGLQSIDLILSFKEDTPASLIEKVNPNFLVKGGDYKPSDIAGAKWVENHGGEVVILPFLKGYSSTSLIDKIRSTQ